MVGKHMRRSFEVHIGLWQGHRYGLRRWRWSCRGRRRGCRVEAQRTEGLVQRRERKAYTACSDYAVARSVEDCIVREEIEEDAGEPGDRSWLLYY